MYERVLNKTVLTKDHGPPGPAKSGDDLKNSPISTSTKGKPSKIVSTCREVENKASLPVENTTSLLVEKTANHKKPSSIAMVGNKTDHKLVINYLKDHKLTSIAMVEKETDHKPASNYPKDHKPTSIAIVGSKTDHKLASIAMKPLVGDKTGHSTETTALKAAKEASAKIEAGESRKQSRRKNLRKAW